MSVDPAQGLVCSLTCLRLHREVRLSLQYAVHQPGTVAIGGVISICSCHLHHWRTYRTDTQTWQTSQEMTLPQRFGSRMVWQTSLSQRACRFTCLLRLDGERKWKTLSLYSDTAAELLLWGWSPLLFLSISSLSDGNIHFPILVIFK